MGNLSVEGSSPQVPVTQSKQQHTADKIPGCVSSIKLFCKIFHLEEPQFIKIISLEKKASKQLHKNTGDASKISTKQAVESVKSSAPNTVEEKYKNFKDKLNKYEKQVAQENDKAKLKALKKEFEGKEEGIGKEFQELAKANVESFSTWQRFFNKIKAAIDTRIQTLEKQEKPAAPFYGDRLHIGSLRDALDRQVAKSYVRFEPTGLINAKRHEVIAKKNEITKTERQFKNYQNELALAHFRTGYDALPEEKKIEIDKQIKVEVGVSLLDIHTALNALDNRLLELKQRSS